MYSEEEIDLLAGGPMTSKGQMNDKFIIERLDKVDKPVILIINKVDTVEKEKVIEYIDTYRKVYDFAEIIPTSALRGQNTDDIIDSIFKYLPYGPMFYDEDTITDQPIRQIVAELIREKAHMSKNEFKRAVGHLLKENRICFAVYVERAVSVTEHRL